MLATYQFKEENSLSSPSFNSDISHPPQWTGEEIVALTDIFKGLVNNELQPKDQGL